MLGCPLELCQNNPMILIHSTHEAGFKLGGIGAVLDGLLGAPSYLAQVEHTLLAGPMNTRDTVEMERLFSPRNKLKVRYFAGADQIDCPPALEKRLREIEDLWNVHVLYGTRAFGGAEHEIILVDPGDIDHERFNQFKYFVWERFGLDSTRYEGDYEFNLYMAAAQPCFAALQAVLEMRDPEQKMGGRFPVIDLQPPVLICHEFMGLPLWYAAELSRRGVYKSAYVAHEVPSARVLVENDPGHDTRFYNALRYALRSALTMDEVFGDQSGYFKHALVKTASRCDYVLAVGDLVVDELRFIDARFRSRRIDLVYNGVPNRQVFIEDVRRSGRKLRDYARTLTGLAPAFVFSHATRMVISKGLWRDLRVMEELDALLAARGESAVLFILSSVIPLGRSAAEAQRMAREYGWPGDHREGWPDLIALETPLWQAIAAFNNNARASRIVLINQFGFSRDLCGDTMPADLSFDDLRIGTDLEFGQSIYEPFGIAQVEPLPCGALCVVSDVCGCLGFVNRQLSQLPRFAMPDASGQLPADLDENSRAFLNVLVADYTSDPAPDLHPQPDLKTGLSHALAIGQNERDAIERAVAHATAGAILRRLPRTDAQKSALIENGYLLAQQMSWDVVAREQLLPAITR